MGITIFVPENTSPLIERFDQNDCSGLFRKLSSWPLRSMLFYEELVVGFIVHTNHISESDPPQTVYLELKSNSEAYPLANGGLRISYNATNDDTPPKTLEVLSAVVQNPITCEEDIDGTASSVTIWKFEVPVGYPKHDMTGPITLHASLANPHLQVPAHEGIDDVNLRSSLPTQSANLFEGLNFHISEDPSQSFLFSQRLVVLESQHGQVDVPEPLGDRTHEELEPASPDDSTSLSIALSIPLAVKLRSTKPGGRNDILLSTLSIEASSELLNLFTEDKDSCYINILGLEVKFRSGEITELGHLSFPRRCHINDVVNITYKLINNDYLDSQMKNATGAPLNTARPLSVNLRIRIEMYDNFTEEYVSASNEISTLWSPLLEFGILAPPISAAMKTFNNASNFQVQSQFNSLATVVKHNGNLPRKTAMAHNVTGVHKSKALPTPSILSPSVSHPLASSGLAFPSSPLIRNIPPSSSSPLLSLTRGQGLSKKNQKSMLTLPTISSSVTVNLSSNMTFAFTGLFLTFKGDLSIELGKIVTWKIQAINQAGRTLNLSLIVKNPRRRHPIYLQNDSSSGAALGNVSSTNMVCPDDSTDSSLHIYNKLQLYSQYNLLKLGRGGVVLLTNDVRLGPIEPNQVVETEIQLIGIAKGIFNLDGLRVVDLNNGDGIDFGRLVEVFVM